MEIVMSSINLRKSWNQNQVSRPGRRLLLLHVQWRSIYKDPSQASFSIKFPLFFSMKRRWKAHWLVMKGPVTAWLMQTPCWDLVLHKCSTQKAAVSWPQTLGYIHLCITCMNNATGACISKCAMKQLGFINFFSTYTWP